MPTVEIKRAGTDLQRRIEPNNQQFVQTEDLSYLDAVQEQAQRWKQAEDATYVAKTTTELEKQDHAIRKQLEQEFFNNPQGFLQAYEQATESLYAQAVKNAPSVEARNSMTRQAEASKLHNLGKAMQWEQQSTLANYLETHVASVSDISNILADDPSEENFEYTMGLLELENTAAEKYLSPAEHMKLARGNRAAMAQTYIESMAQKEQFKSARKELNSGRFDTLLDAAQQQKLHKIIDAAEVSAQAKATANAAKQRTQRFNAVQESIFLAGSTADLESVIQGVEQSVLNDDPAMDIASALKLTSMAQGKLKDLRDTEFAVVTVAEAFAKKAPITDPKLLDPYYDDYLVNHTDPEATPHERSMQAITHIASFSGQVPPKIKPIMVANLNSANEKVVAATAQTIVELSKLHPNVAKEFSSELSFAHKVNSQIISGVSPEKAVDLAQRLQNARNVPEDQERVSRFNSQDIQDVFEDAVADHFDVDSIQELPAGMVVGLRQATLGAFVVNKNTIEDATQVALKQYSTRWGRSAIFEDDRYVFQPPEMLAPENAPEDWAREQLLEQIDAFLGTTRTKQLPKHAGPATLMSGPPSVELYEEVYVPSDTAEDFVGRVSDLIPTVVKGKLAYKVYYTDAASTQKKQIIDKDTGKPFLFFPNVAETAWGKEQKRQREAYDAETARMNAELEQRRVEFEKEQARRVSGGLIVTPKQVGETLITTTGVE